MADTKKIGKWMLTGLWVLIAAGTVMLLVAANNKGKQQLCAGMEVTIQGVSRHCFLNKDDVLLTINEYLEDGPKGQPVSSFNLLAMESELSKNVWVRKIEMYFDNNYVLQVNVHEREPVARIFTAGGESFYIDSSRMILPLSQTYAARLPVFTGFPTDRRVLNRVDSLLLSDVVKISQAIRSQDLLMALIEQIDITPKRDFEIIPKIGNGSIYLGPAEAIGEKFEKLLVFYRKVIMEGRAWDFYSRIDLRFRNQVVARRRDAADVVADSVAVKAIRQTIEAYARRLASDTLQLMMSEMGNPSETHSIPMESFERDERDAFDLPILIPTVLTTIKPTKAQVQKNSTMKTASAPKTEQSITHAKSVPYPMKKPPGATPSRKPSSGKPVKQTSTNLPAGSKNKPTVPEKTSNDYH